MRREAIDAHRAQRGLMLAAMARVEAGREREPDRASLQRSEATAP
jgi:hypothetical protein